MRSITLFISFLIILSFSSCKKIDKDKIPSPGDKELLTSKVWLLQGIKNSKGTSYTDETNCNNYIKWKFFSSGDFEQLEKCTDNQTISSTWTLNGKALSIDESKDANYTVVSITASSMELKVDDNTSYLFRSF